MKNRFRYLICLLVLASLFSACSDEAQHSSMAPEAMDILGDDAVAAIDEILEVPERFDRTEQLMAALQAVPKDQADVFESVMNKLRMPFRELERVLIVTAWAKSDPESATKWVMRKQKDELLRATMFSETVYQWALNDPTSLRTDFKVGMYSVNGWDATMLRAFVRGWLESGEPELEDFIRDLRNGDDRQRAISELIKDKLKVETPDAMIAWATALKGDPKYRSYVHARLAGDIAKTDPQRAIKWCDEICETPLGADLPHWIVSAWVKDGGAEAMDWIMAQSSESAAVRVGVRSAFRRFQIGFPEESDAWVEAFAEEDRLTQKYQGPVIMYVNRQSNLNRPEVAIEWSKYIENDWERSRSLTTVGNRWMRRDEEAAEAWLTETTDVSAEVKAEIRAKLRQHKVRVEKTRKELDMKPDWVVDRDEM